MSPLTGLHNYHSRSQQHQLHQYLERITMDPCKEMRPGETDERMDVSSQRSARDISSSTLTSSNNLLKHLHGSFKFIFPINCSYEGFFPPNLCACLISLLHIADSLINCAKCFLKLIITLLPDHSPHWVQPRCHGVIHLESEWFFFVSLCCFPASIFYFKMGKVLNERRNTCTEGVKRCCFYNLLLLEM